MTLFLRFLRSSKFRLRRRNISKNFEARQKYSAARRIFIFLFAVFGNAMKQSLECLIYYFEAIISKLLSRVTQSRLSFDLMVLRAQKVTAFKRSTKESERDYSLKY